MLHGVNDIIGIELKTKSSCHLAKKLFAFQTRAFQFKLVGHYAGAATGETGGNATGVAMGATTESTTIFVSSASNI